jgi:hypothetical protein
MAEKSKDEQILELNRKLRNVYQKRYRHNKVDKDKIIDVFGIFGEKALGIFDSMIQASVSNPLLGITSALVLGDILYRAKVIDIQTWTMIGVSCGVLEGAAVAGGIIQDVGDFFKVFQSQSQSPDPIQPSATTVVFGDKKNDLQALMNRENVKS